MRETQGIKGAPGDALITPGLVPQDATVLTFNHLNGHAGLYSYVHGGNAAHGDAPRKFIPLSVQSIFGMRSISYFVPVYAETVAYTWEALSAEGTLQHLIDLYACEWRNFCARVFYGAAPEKVRPPGHAADPAPPQRCIRREGTSEAAPEAVRQAVGGGWGRLLSVANAIEAGTWRQGDSDWA